MEEERSLYNNYLDKLMSQFEGRCLKAQILPRRDGQNKTKVNVDYVAISIKQDVPIVSEQQTENSGIYQNRLKNVLTRYRQQVVSTQQILLYNFMSF